MMRTHDGERDDVITIGICTASNDADPDPLAAAAAAHDEPGSKGGGTRSFLQALQEKADKAAAQPPAPARKRKHQRP